MHHWAPGFTAEKIRSEGYWRYVIIFFLQFSLFLSPKISKKGMRISYLRELAF